MTGTELLRALGDVDERYIAEYDSFRPKRRFGRLAAAAASVVFVLAAGLFTMWLNAPANTGYSEQILKTTILPIDGWLAEYQILDDYDITNYEKLTVFSKPRELLAARSDASYYRLKDDTGIYRLIRVNNDGSEELLQFRRFSINLPENMTRSVWYELGLLTDEDLNGLYYGKTHNFGYVLESIHEVTSADGIKSVRFADAGVDNTRVGEKIKIKEVTLRDEASLERFYEILASLTRTDDSYRGGRVFTSDEAYLSGEVPLSEQTEREVIITLKSGVSLSFVFQPTENRLFENYTIMYDPIPPEDTAWLIEAAGIDMEWRDWGTNEQPTGSETTSLPKTGS